MILVANSNACAPHAAAIYFPIVATLEQRTNPMASSGHELGNKKLKVHEVLLMSLLGALFGCSQNPDSFTMKIDDVFHIGGNEGLTVVTGTITTGKITVGDSVTVKGKTYTVSVLEHLRKETNEAKAGENIGIGFRNVDSGAFHQGDVVTK